MFKKIVPFLLVILWAVSGSGDEGCCPKPCCTPPAPCCWQFNPCNPKKCTDMNCGGFYVSADFLYWRAENHGFSYAYEVTDSIRDIGNVVRIDPKWNPGFRVGLGWNTTHDFWDVFANYTWYRNNAHEKRTAGITFIGLWPVDFGDFRDVSADSPFNLNMGDFEVGRLVYLTRSLAVRPHWGARGGTIHQQFNSSFTNDIFSARSQLDFHGKNNYWGVGPRVGFNGEWHLSKGFSLLGNAAGALLYGKTNVRSLTEQLFIGATAFTINRDYTDHFYQLVPNLQLLLGFQWQTCFWCEKMFFKMSAGWETNIWWDQFNLLVASGTTSPFPTLGNQPLTMEGLTVNFEWDF